MSLFGGGQPNAMSKTVASGVTINSSVYGKVVPIIYGTLRCSGNVIWYGDFVATPQGGGGGKGGGPGGKAGGSTSYTYSANFAVALCEGPIGGVLNQWANKTEYSWAYCLANNINLKTGAQSQAPWGYLTTNHPGQDLGYSETAYVYYQPGLFGTSAQMQNLSFEVQGFGNGVYGTPDADPEFIVSDLLTNAHYGIGFPPARLGDLSIFSNYCRASGMVMSLLLDTQQDAASILNDIVQQSNAELVWSGGQLTIVPYGDQNLSANGATYSAPAAPLYGLTDDDFIGTGSGDPVQRTRARPSDRMNALKLEWSNRANQYAAEIVEVKDQAAIELHGLRAAQPKQAHFFTTLSAATMSATLQLQRQAVRNRYSFTLGWKYCLLDPMDIVSITDPNLGLNQQWVRILSIEENDNGDLTVTAEEYLGGTGAAPLYSLQSGNPFIGNYNAPPGPVNRPIILEPPISFFAGTPQLMIGASGGSPSWGGCDIYLSLDGANYELLGHVDKAASMGTTTAALPAASGNDTTHLLSVDLTESFGALPPSSHATAAGYQTSVWVCDADYTNGEMIGYGAGPTLTGPHQYSLKDGSGSIYLQRGQLGTNGTAHAAGSMFMLFDQSVFTMSLPPWLIGVTLHFKFVSSNIFGAAQESLASVTDYTYTPAGIASAVQPPGPVTPTTSLIVQPDGTIQSAIPFSWIASGDPLLAQYEVQLQLSGTGAWDLKHVVSANSNSYTEVPVRQGAYYDIRVRAVRITPYATYYSAWSPTATIQAQAQGIGPGPCSGLKPVGTTRGFAISWTNPADHDYGYAQLWATDITPDPAYGFDCGRFPGQPGQQTTIALTQVVGIPIVWPTMAQPFVYFWVRSFNTSGVAGLWNPTFTAYSGIAPNPPLQQNVTSSGGAKDIANNAATTLATVSFSGAGAITTNVTFTINDSANINITAIGDMVFAGGTGWAMQVRDNAGTVLVQTGNVFSGSTERLCGIQYSSTSPLAPGTYTYQIVWAAGGGVTLNTCFASVSALVK